VAKVEHVLVVGHEDCFKTQIDMVTKAIDEKRTQPTRPSPNMADSISIMEILTELAQLK
jgi:carbonic anhydrase